MKGFLIVDKPSGITSFDVVAQARRQLEVRKIGHLGTLDPLATGVLVLAVGEGTKLIEYLMGADKEYEATLEFGKTSDTYDSEGTVIETGAEIPSGVQLEAVLEQFRGEIEQIPPAFSALKINGQRAYDLARKGEKVELKSRKVRIDKLELMARSDREARSDGEARRDGLVAQGPTAQGSTAQLHIHCSSGTYIRSIIHDLGQVLGCGAIMTALRRTRVGGFQLNEAHSPAEIIPENLIPLERVVIDWPTIKVNEDECHALHQGQKIPIGATSKTTSDLTAAATAATILAILHNDQLVSLAELNRGFLSPVKNFML